MVDHSLLLFLTLDNSFVGHRAVAMVATTMSATRVVAWVPQQPL